MSKVCFICGKRPVAGRQIVRRGLAKKEGGVGRKIVRVSKRRFLPNLQRVKAVVEGSVKHIRVCTNCIKSGRVKKAA
ncbi:MAG: 50S ribosomal protein L28 [Candidatus Omnitrophica bacterium]|nr:50S ribosomal protein L28 [Candidatus Omnitrophota bacterium]